MNEITNISAWFSWFFGWENIQRIFTYNESEPLIFTAFFFWGFFAVVLVFYSFIHKKRALRNAFLFFVSLFFYYKTSGLFISILLFSTLCDYIIGWLIYSSKKKLFKQLFVASSVLINLFVLCYFKYAYFFTDSFNAFFQTNYEVFNHFAQFTNDNMGTHFEVNKILLPVGISFYTFQTISYSVDIYRKEIKPVKSILDFGFYVSFFPQLVAGPIVRASYFLPQLNDDHQEKPDAMESGVALIIRGFIKKVAFADVLAVHFVDPAFADPGQYSPLFLLVGIYAYSFQVYMDFSGYTDIARGVARTLGYELQINFNRPYKSVSVSNFWQRWHISMSSFFRDYLFFGIGGSKYGNVYINLMITFIAIGIWHGAGWNFVIYGALHGAFVGIERWRRNSRAAAGLKEPEYHGLRLVTQWFWIFNVVAFSRLLFRGGTLDSTVEYAKAMVDFSVTSIPINMMGAAVFLLAIVLHYTPTRWTNGWKDFYCRVPVVIQAGGIVGIMYLLVAISTEEAPFIYFQF